MACVMAESKVMRVLLVGGSGLVGSACLALLANDPQVMQVRVLLRRALTAAELLGQHASPQAMAKLQVVAVDFDHLEEYTALFAVDAVVCALGTTIKQAGSQAAFCKVDHDYPLAVARLAKAQGAQQFLMVSALGAQASSRVFYNRVKGEVENAITDLGFSSFTIAQPSLLLGERAEFRLGETIATMFAWLVPGPWAPVHARQVARALVHALNHPAKGRHILQNMAMRRFSAAPVQIHSSAPTHF
jgi:uncharacterized protein YbjT (DUF2867 family)